MSTSGWLQSLASCDSAGLVMTCDCFYLKEISSSRCVCCISVYYLAFGWT